jgi:hypothetical protein
MEISELINNQQMAGIKSLCRGDSARKEAANVAAQQKRQEIRLKKSIQHRIEKIREYKAAGMRVNYATKGLERILSRFMKPENSEAREALSSVPGFEDVKSVSELLQGYKQQNELVRCRFLEHAEPDKYPPDFVEQFLHTLDVMYKDFEHACVSDMAKAFKKESQFIGKDGTIPGLDMAYEKLGYLEAKGESCDCDIYRKVIQYKAWNRL